MDNQQIATQADGHWNGGSEVSSDKDRIAHNLQMLASEQVVLTQFNIASISESNTRASLYLAVSSGGIVSLSFIGQYSRFGDEFYAFALGLFPIVFFLGAITFARMVDIAVQNVVYTKGMNRIRHYYTQLAPELYDYFVLSTNDDYRGAARTMGTLTAHPAVRPWWTGFVTTAGMVALLNSLTGGVLVAMVSFLAFDEPVLVATAVWFVAFVLLIYAHLRYEMRRWRDLDRRVKAKFPSDPEA